MVREDANFAERCGMGTLLFAAVFMVGSIFDLVPIAAGQVIEDIGPRCDKNGCNFSLADPTSSPSGRALSLTVSKDSLTLYAGTFSGVWRSRDGGGTWVQLIPPPPSDFDCVPEALKVAHIFYGAVLPTDSP